MNAQNLSLNYLSKRADSSNSYLPEAALGTGMAAGLGAEYFLPGAFGRAADRILAANPLDPVQSEIRKSLAYHHLNDIKARYPEIPISTTESGWGSMSWERAGGKFKKLGIDFGKTPDEAFHELGHMERMLKYPKALPNLIKGLNYSPWIQNAALLSTAFVPYSRDTRENVYLGTMGLGALTTAAHIGEEVAADRAGKKILEGYLKAPVKSFLPHGLPMKAQRLKHLAPALFAAGLYGYDKLSSGEFYARQYFQKNK